MRKPGEYQKRVERQQRLRNISIITIIVLLILWISYNIVFELQFLYHMGNDNLETYSGEYDYRVALIGKHASSRGRVFVLNNGVRIRVSTSYLPSDDEMKQYNELVFRYYSEMPTLIRNYAVASITTIDGGTVLFSEDDAIDSSNASMFASKLVLLIIFVTLLLLLCCEIRFRLVLYRRPHRKLNKEKN